MNLLINADARQIPLADGSVNCIVTSPPYYGLRNYQVDEQIGLEQTPQEYIDNLVQVFRECWRILRDDGTVWLNLGDSYNGSGGAGGDYIEGGLKEGQPKYPGRHINNLKPKDLIGIPWMVAFALRDDGWYLRQDIIWAKACSGNIRKGSAMPESVTDRFQKSHEYIFLLSKSPRYYFDNEAVKEKCVTPDDMQVAKRNKSEHKGQRDPGGRRQTTAGFDKINKVYEFGNRRSVWFVNPKPYKGAHFATYPPELIEPCILAGCPQQVCSKCGAPYKRVATIVGEQITESMRIAGCDNNGHYSGNTTKDYKSAKAQNASDTKRRILESMSKVKEYNWQPTCNCGAEPISGIVFDPFVGSGTTVAVANRLGRRGIGVDLSYNYLQLAQERVGKVQLPLV
jgi:site-specific DNA-methyltransferase (adenine-specific)